MDRGRPRKRSDGTPIGSFGNGNGNGNGGGLKRSNSKRSVSAERRAFENLPQGWKPSEAVNNIDSSEIAYLQKQALGQTLRFEVLKKDDVENLSKVGLKYHSIIVFNLIIHRNYATSMSEQSIFVARIHLFVPGAETFTAAFASTCGHLVSLNLATSPC